MVNSLSRFQVVPHNRLVAPGKCCVCGNISGDFIDFGWTLNFYGAVYFCKDNCFREAAQQLGYISEEAYLKVDDMFHRVDQINMHLRKENEELRNALDVIDRVRASITSVDTTSMAVESEQPEDDSGSKGDEQGSVESSAKSRSASVRNNDSATEDFLAGL